MQVLYTLYTDVASKNLNCLSFFLFFLLMYMAILFIFYSNTMARPSKLQLEEKSDTTPL